MTTTRLNKMFLTLCAVLTIGVGSSALAPHVAAAFEGSPTRGPVPAAFDDEGSGGSYHFIDDDEDEDDEIDDDELPAVSGSAGSGGDMVSASPSFTG